MFKKAEAGRVIIVVPQAIIFELHYVLLKYYKFDKLMVVEKLGAIVKQAYSDVEDKGLMLSSLAIYVDSNISFIDSFLVAKSRSEKIDLFTFDKKLQVQK